MDSAFALLKEEINKTQEAEHDLAKWKIAVVAALGAAGLGLGKESDPNKSWLLVLVPFVCAYIDLYAYQNSLRILVIARFLREYPHGDDQILRDYEERCDTLRKQRVFSLGTRAGTWSSVVLSLTWPLFYLAQRSKDLGGLQTAISLVRLKENSLVLVVWLFGVFLILFLRRYYGAKADKLAGANNEKKRAPIEAQL